VSTAFTVWCTGLPSSGKSQLADTLATAIRARGVQTEVINSGKMRQTPLGASLGFSKDDRDTNIQRHAFAANLLVKNGVVAIVSAVSPYADTRAAVRKELGDFVEVYVSTPKADCIDRDKDGAWARALKGEIRGFTGVDDPYEEPETPDVDVDLAQLSLEAAANRVLAKLEQLGLVAPIADGSAEDAGLLDPSLRAN
jgi:adenylylsulfate kinase